jgi:hypothetical protein
MEEPITTSDMSLACYLWYRGHDLLEIQWEEKRCSWTFPDKANEDLEEYTQGKARVDPMSYFPSVAKFKKIVWDSNPRNQ